jgi:hypothetical protein
MTPLNPRQIWAKYDHQSITVYQAYNSSIADEALALGRFGSLFRRNRMTWIKPSFLWMMYRSKWASAPNQERVLAIKLSISGFTEILARAVLTKFDPSVHPSRAEWQKMLRASDVRCQWDPDRTPTGVPRQRRAIQLGLKSDAVRRYVEEWCLEIQDITQFVHHVHSLVKAKQKELPMLPQEHLFSVNEQVAFQLGMDLG